MADKKLHGTTPDFRGEKHPGCKLTKDVVLGIRARCATGETHKSVADHYGVTRSNVGAIARRKTWKHI